ncbi:hypothetical protein HK101_006701 [Irineochytrium annulatum]|nr:hypothetical protein HK101_006701 [Irineochytrium annulatum]
MALTIAPALIVVYVLGFALTVTVITAYVRHRKELLATSIDLLFCFVLVVDLIWCIACFSLEINVVVNPQSGWSRTQCDVSGITVVGCAGNAIAAHAMIAVDRWLSVIARVQDSRPWLLGALVTQLLLFVVLSVGQTHFSARKFELMESGVYCFLPLVAIDGDYGDLIWSYFTTCYCVVATGVIVAAYGHIYVRFFRVRRSVHAQTHAESDDKKDIPGTRLNLRGPDFDLERRQVFFRCICLASAFLLTYSILFGNFMYRVLAGRHVPAWLDGLGGTVSSADLVVTPIMIVVMNKKVLRAVEAVIGIRLPPWRPADKGHNAEPVGKNVGVEPAAS